MPLSQEALEDHIKSSAPEIAAKIKAAASSSANEAEFRAKVRRHIEDFAESGGLNLVPREEYTLINGRADAVYNRFVIEYEPPRSLRENLGARTNQHAIEQVKSYIEGLVRLERHRHERLAGVAMDGSWFIFVRSRDGVWKIDPAVPVDRVSTERFLRTLASLSTELALIPENLVRDFGENSNISRLCVSTLYEALSTTTNQKVKVLFEQWSLQFSEVCDYAEASKLDVAGYARSYGVKEKKPDPFRLFFCIHAYYATFIKLLALQIIHYYAMPRLGTDLKQAASFPSERFCSYLQKMERGGLFKELGINNFLEGDFFGWYLDIWDERIDRAVREIISTLANYSLVTLDVDPEATRDLLKKLYQNVMPKALRHNLGEYYTPDWLAQRTLVQLYGNFRGTNDPLVDPRKRLLDPACGSGTFLVLGIRFARKFAEENLSHWSEAQLLEKILENFYGFDLNPLAVISARTNYLLALGDLLQHRKGEINIPIYLCDSILTPSESKDLFGHGLKRFNTAVGPFAVPVSLVSARYIDLLANLLEQAIEVHLSDTQFRQKLLEVFPLDQKKDDKDIVATTDLYRKIQDLDSREINGIWARIIKNAFAPLFAGEFDYVAGNPPWINWEHLPEQYRKDIAHLWTDYNLFTHRGLKARLGSAKDDISVLMLYVAADRYLRHGGKLGFIITQTVFKSEGGGEGFRRFRLGDKGEPLRVLYVDDLSSLKPFEGAANRTAVIVLHKGQPTKYPVGYSFWRKKVKGSGLPESAPLSEITSSYVSTSRWEAEPIDSQNPTSPWISGRPLTLRAVKRVIGPSAYRGREGSNTGGLNGAYWVEIVDKRPDGLVLVSNCGDIGKKSVETLPPTAIESDLLFPLLRGQDVGHWKAQPSLCIIIPQDPENPARGYPEEKLKTRCPKTYAYLDQFKSQLQERSGYKKFFNPAKDPFYSMYNVGPYTFAPYKVAWREVSADLRAAVVEPHQTGKPVVPDHTLIAAEVGSKEEAHYLCALLNSSVADFIVRGYVALHPSPHVMKYIPVPKFSDANELHRALAKASTKAHKATKDGQLEVVRETEAEVDELATKLWGLKKEELKDIEESLKDLRNNSS